MSPAVEQTWQHVSRFGQVKEKLPKPFPVHHLLKCKLREGMIPCLIQTCPVGSLALVVTIATIPSLETSVGGSGRKLCKLSLEGNSEEIGQL